MSVLDILQSHCIIRNIHREYPLSLFFAIGLIVCTAHFMYFTIPIACFHSKLCFSLHLVKEFDCYFKSKLHLMVRLYGLYLIFDLNFMLAKS